MPSQETVKNMVETIARRDIPVRASAIACRPEHVITGDQKDFAGWKTGKRCSLTVTGPSELVETVFPGIIKNLR